MKAIIGAHVSAAGGLKNVVPRAQAIGAEAVQIFASAPGNWNPPKATINEAEEFAEAYKTADIQAVFFHSIYLINLASSNEELVRKSIESLVLALNLNAAMKGNGVVFHVGSSKEKSFDEVKNSVIKSINTILNQSDDRSILIIETNAGQGNNIGDTFEEVAALIDGVEKKSRIGVCIDTAHTFASGYDLVERGAKSVIDEFNNIVGLKYLKAIHCNDSKTAFNSRVDRHENIGKGHIGLDVFKQLLNLNQLDGIPFILEVPGFSGQGPDKENIDLLRSLIS